MKTFKTIDDVMDNLTGGIIIEQAGYDSSIFIKMINGPIYVICPLVGIIEQPKPVDELKSHFIEMLNSGATISSLHDYLKRTED